VRVSEQPITRAVIDALNATHRAVVWRAQSGKVQVRGAWMYLAPEGTPDVLGFSLLDGRMIGIEVKDPKGTTNAARRAAQEAWRKQALAAGCIAGQVTSVDEALRLVLRPEERG
jgi:hypothetical protein